MYKHPFSAAFRLLPVLSWLFVLAISLWMSAQLLVWMVTQDLWNAPAKPWLELAGIGAFIALAIYSARTAYKDYKEAWPAIREDRPLLPPFPRFRQPPPRPPTRYPLTDAQKIQLQTSFATLLATGVLSRDDITFEALIDCVELLDDFSAADCSEADVIFNALASRAHRQGFSNLAFFEDQVEVDEAMVLDIVRDFARLAGQAGQLNGLRLRGIAGGEVVLARRGEFPPDNAVVEFDLGSRHHAVPFVMYGKNTPLGLMEKLAQILILPGEARRFFSAYFSNPLVTFIAPDQAATLNLAFSHQPDCFELVK